MSMPKFAAKDADQILGRLDKIAKSIESNYESWGMPVEAARDIVNALDKTADEIEITAFGKESFVRRQAEVVQREPDEPYMDTFKNPQQPHQTDADEKYMSEYKVDQSSELTHAKSTTGRPLAPGH